MIFPRKYGRCFTRRGQTGLSIVLNRCWRNCIAFENVENVEELIEGKTIFLFPQSGQERQRINCKVFSGSPISSGDNAKPLFLYKIQLNLHNILDFFIVLNDFSSVKRHIDSGVLQGSNLCPLLLKDLAYLHLLNNEHIS